MELSFHDNRSELYFWENDDKPAKHVIHNKMGWGGVGGSCRRSKEAFRRKHCSVSRGKLRQEVTFRQTPEGVRKGALELGKVPDQSRVPFGQSPR